MPVGVVPEIKSKMNVLVTRHWGSVRIYYKGHPFLRLGQHFSGSQEASRRAPRRRIPPNRGEAVSCSIVVDSFELFRCRVIHRIHLVRFTCKRISYAVQNATTVPHHPSSVPRREVCMVLMCLKQHDDDESERFCC